MAIDQYFKDYIQDTAGISIIRSKAASPCKNHPDTLILSKDPHAWELAYNAAIRTLAYNIKLFLKKYIIEAVSSELSFADAQCIQCLKYVRYNPFEF